MSEYIIRPLSGRPERLFVLLEKSGMAVMELEDCFLYVLQGEKEGWFVMSHVRGAADYACKYFAEPEGLWLTALRAKRLFHVDGFLRHDIDTLIAALEEEIEAHCAGEALHPSTVSEERRA